MSHEEVSRCLDGLGLLEPMREGFRAHSAGRTGLAQRVECPIRLLGTAAVMLPGLVPGIPAYSVKVHGRFPANPLPTQGALLLHDLESGELLAVMDSVHLSALASGVVGAVAADALARPEASRVAIIGAGTLGSVHLKCLRLVRTLSHVRVFDSDSDKAHAFAVRIHRQLQLPIRVATSVAEAVEDADLVVTATSAREPLLSEEMLAPGTHVSSFGSDALGKQELTLSCLRAARWVCDDLRLTASLFAEAELRVRPVELGEVLAGTRPGRAAPDELTVFTSVGLPLVELVAAWQAYQCAGEEPEHVRFQFAKVV